MMRVLISDDEIQIRKGLRMKIDWQKEGFEVVAEASNGKEALEKLEQFDVDIVLTDVRMPIMDGMEFAKRCHDDFPDVKVIVLSGYSDFEYAKTSMQAGVKDYLLKPVAPDELLEALQKVKVEIEEEKKTKWEANEMRQIVEYQLEEMREQYLLNLVKEEFMDWNNTTERMHQLKLEKLAVEDVKVQFVTVEMRDNTASETTMKERWHSFKKFCKELAEKSEGTYVFYDTSYTSMLHFIHRIEGEPLTNTSPIITNIQKELYKQLKVETIIGIGKVVEGHSQFKNGYISALLSWSQSQVNATSQVIEGTMNQEVFDFTLDIEKKLTHAIENVDRRAYANALKEILSEDQSMMSFSFTANRVLFSLGSLSRKYDMQTTDVHNMLWTCQQSIWALNAQRKVLDQLLQLAEVMMDKINEVRSSSSGTELIENVRRFIDTHYASEVSLTSLSKQFHINSAYLSELFKTHVGQNFSDYLYQVRMEHASRLLKDSQLKIIDVAHLVGFSNSGYFSTVFKKFTGQTPAEYRKAHGTN